MPAILLKPNSTWLLLIAATAATFCVRADGFVGPLAAATTLGIAWVKGRMVILDFMELRDAPRIWRGLIEGWLMLTTTLVFATYWIGPLVLAINR